MCCEIIFIFFPGDNESVLRRSSGNEFQRWGPGRRSQMQKERSGWGKMKIWGDERVSQCEWAQRDVAEKAYLWLWRCKSVFYIERSTGQGDSGVAVRLEGCGGWRGSLWYDQVEAQLTHVCLLVVIGHIATSNDSRPPHICGLAPTDSHIGGFICIFFFCFLSNIFSDFWFFQDFFPTPFSCFFGGKFDCLSVLWEDFLELQKIIQKWSGSHSQSVVGLLAAICPSLLSYSHGCLLLPWMKPIKHLMYHHTHCQHFTPQAARLML